MSQEADQIRGYIQLAEFYMGSVDHVEPMPEPEQAPSSLNEAVVDDLREIVSKLRGHTELDENADQAVGVEIGMQRAADMIERVIMEATRGKAA